MSDDVWFAMAASYWRITSAIDRKIREECEGAPDFMHADITQEVLETAYLEERELWSKGMDRLCEIYGVPEGEAPAAQPVTQGALF